MSRWQPRLRFLVNSWQRWISYYRLPILSGILIGTSYIPFPVYTLFFCLVPLFLFFLQSTQPLSLKQAWTAGWLTQFVLTLIGFHWVGHTAHAFGHMPWPVAAVILLAFCSFAHLYYGLATTAWCLITRWVPMNAKISLLVFLALFSLLERHYPSIFPWNFGYPWLWNSLPGYHWADIVGFEGLSSLTVLINALLALAWMERRRRARGWAWAGAALALFLAVNISGSLHGRKWPEPSAVFKVAVIQPNIGNLEKEYAQHGRGYQQWIIHKHLSLTQLELKSHPDPQLVIWPETSYPDFLEDELRSPILALPFDEFFREHHIPVLTGAYSKDLEGGHEYNALFLFDAQGRLTGPPYRKSRLLAFGEYFPLGDWFPFLYHYVQEVSNFGRGAGPTVLTEGRARLGAQICYEGLFPEFSAELATKGAEILVNVTNDSWFGATFEPYQHLTMTLARGIEVRRPVIRVTNTGISRAIDARGQLTASSPLQAEWTGTFEVPYIKTPPLTFFTLYNGWIPIVWLALLATLVLGSLLCRAVPKK